jgi:hypothetical protein
MIAIAVRGERSGALERLFGWDNVLAVAVTIPYLRQKHKKLPLGTLIDHTVQVVLFI